MLEILSVAPCPIDKMYHRNGCCQYVTELVVNYSARRLTKTSFPEYILLIFSAFTNRMSFFYSSYPKLLITQHLHALCVGLKVSFQNICCDCAHIVPLGYMSVRKDRHVHNLNRPDPKIITCNSGYELHSIQRFSRILDMLTKPVNHLTCVAD
jgi:hypothetical protein